MTESENEPQNPRPTRGHGADDDHGDTGETTGLWSGFRVSDGSWEEDAEGQVVRVVSDTPHTNASGPSQDAPSATGDGEEPATVAPDQPDPVGGPPADEAVGTSDDDQQASITGISDAQVRANRRNARRSTGPRTPEGKRASSQNATRHGIFAGPHPIRRGSLAEPPDEVDRFQEGIMRVYRPDDPLEDAWAGRLANKELNLARLDRYIPIALAEAGGLGDSEDEQQLDDKLSWQRWQIEGVIQAREVLEAGLDGSEEAGQRDWTALMVPLYARQCVPAGGPERPEIPAKVDEEFQARCRSFLVDELLPHAGRQTLITNLTASLQRLQEELCELEALEEEIAVDRATERGGVLDRLSALQARMQKDLEREREAYFKWQRRRRRAEARGHPDESEEDLEEPED